MHLMIFGAGYSGRVIGATLAPACHHVSGTTRTADKAAALGGVGIETFIFDGAAIDASLAHKLRSVTHIVQTIPPGAEGDPVLNIASRSAHQRLPSLQWLCYLSTVGVYGDHDGEWVDETSECRPTSERSKRRLAAEQQWLETGEKHGLPVAILRLSGIYGPGRNPFRKLQDGTAQRIIKEGQVFNRIRVEDIAYATSFLAEHGFSGIYNVTDSLPAPPQDVITEAARLMGIEPPPEIAFEDADLSPMARSFWGENKRVSNAKLKKLGYEFEFPDYHQSLKQLWDMKAF
ncbi:SDR family oxidoreductase [Martelella endophytica]|uniref:Oxidoreductase n=1 Tax=Martelella endophytica TaxID=1486262 RepID=A0A0D5LW48_MAREN|nr:SDR family oxidoreductase [Martelella endophytica]AJY47618.1 oxidoreductase [Martelella endophytica]